MAEISTVAIITAKPGRGDELEPLLRSLAEATHGEDGCVLYSLQRGLQDRDVFVTVEKWESAGPLEQHLATDRRAWDVTSPGRRRCGWRRPPARRRPCR